VKLYEDWLSTNSIKNPIDTVRYGNQTIDMKVKSGIDSTVKTWFLSRPNLIQDIIESAPTNASETTRNELEELIQTMSNITQDEWLFALRAEEDHIGIWIEFCMKHKLDVTRGDLERVESASDPILFYLKDLVNRPRPHQLASYLDLELYPLIHTDASSAAYPSGHALNSTLFGLLLAEKYPKFATEFLEIGRRVGFSREQAGLHYPSDSAISKKIAQIIFTEKLIEFK
jgi:hypothetical protein